MPGFALSEEILTWPHLWGRLERGEPSNRGCRVDSSVFIPKNMTKQPWTTFSGLGFIAFHRSTTRNQFGVTPLITETRGHNCLGLVQNRRSHGVLNVSHGMTVYILWLCVAPILQTWHGQSPSELPRRVLRDRAANPTYMFDGISFNGLRDKNSRGAQGIQKPTGTCSFGRRLRLLLARFCGLKVEHISEILEPILLQVGLSSPKD